MWGVKYWDGERTSTKVEPIKGLLKRGVWQFDCSDPKFTPQAAKLDNGVTFTDLGAMQRMIMQKREFLRQRKAGMEYRATAEE
jgi:hypothetical protein